MASQEGRATVRPDTKENILYITLSGTIRAKQVEGVYTDIRFAVADLRPGFGVINDLSEANLGYLSGLKTFKKIMSFLVSSKVGPVVRIMGQQSLISKQILRFSAAVEGYTPLYADSLDEARRVLSDQFARTDDG